MSIIFLHITPTYTSGILQVIDRENQMDNPCTGWLSDGAWDNITELDKLTNFHGIITSFEQYPRDWNVWYTRCVTIETAHHTQLVWR